MHILALVYCLVVFWACLAHAGSIQGLTKRVTLDSNCDENNPKIQSSLQAIKNMANDAADAVHWIVHDMNDNSDADEIIRVQDMISTVFGIRLETTGDFRRAGKALQSLESKMNCTYCVFIMADVCPLVN